MKKDDLSDDEHDDDMEQFSNSTRKKAGIRTCCEESVDLKDFFSILKRKIVELISACTNRSDHAKQKILHKLSDGDERNNRAKRTGHRIVGTLHELEDKTENRYQLPSCIFCWLHDV